MENVKICVVGLGYVGLPLARLFSTKYKTVGFDLNERRVAELMSGVDSTKEVDNDVLKKAIDNGFLCTSNVDDIRDCNFYVVAVPTPVDEKYRPDLNPLINASHTIGAVLNRGDIVVYESTTFPGCTEEVCVPALVHATGGMEYNKDFFVGYSPERINPGDKEHTVEKIKKVTSGCNPEIAEIVDSVYRSVLINGTFKASSIKVAEASKIIENTQRDCNIAFFNELSKIFGVMGIKTEDVIQAAATKWNFNVLHPGLVGGHCIGVDPYYLIEKSRECGYDPEFITKARELNEGMGEHVANLLIKKMILNDIKVKDAKILILGFTFKENCPDVRNTKVIKIYDALNEYTNNITVYDPHANKAIVRKEYGISITNELPNEQFDAVLLAVKHKEFDALDLDIMLSLKDL